MINPANETLSRRSKTIRALQCARGFAALLVVYYHASVIAAPSLSVEWTRDTFERLATRGAHLPVFGACGVDLFFVLSGYIIWTSTRPAVSATSFYKRRVARIVPLYWIITTIMALMLLIMPSMFRTLRFSPAHFVASLAFVPWQNPAFSATAPGALTPLCVAGWTLNFEMMFYLLFGIVSARSRYRLQMMILTYATLTVFIFLLRPWLTLLRFYDPFLIAEFLIGCLAATLIERNWICAPSTSIVILILAVATLLISDYLSPPISRLFYCGLPAVMIVYGLVALELKSRWPRMVVLERIGDASYSIYLTHVFALATMRIGWRPIANKLNLPWVESLFVFSAIAAAVAIGFASFRFLERPLVRWTEQILGVRRSAPVRIPVDEVLANSALALRSP